MLRELESVRTQNGQLRAALLRISVAEACMMPGCTEQLPLCPVMLARATIKQHPIILRVN